MQCKLFLVAVLAGSAVFLAANQRLSAADLDGLWVTDASECDQIFVKQGNIISFAKDSDFHGGGFIIDGRQIRGKVVTCTIKSIKHDGATTHLIAACSTDIMLSDTQFSLRFVDRNKIVRLYPGIPEMESNYERCNLK